MRAARVNTAASSRLVVFKKAQRTKGERARALYYDLFGRLIAPRLGRYDGGRVRISVEENTQIREDALRKSVADTYARLVASHARRPLEVPALHMAKKTEEPCLSLPDAFLGVLMAYAIKNGPQPSHMDTWRPDAFALRFEQLRDRYRMILDVVTATTFSRRRTFAPWPNGVPPEGSSNDEVSST